METVKTAESANFLVHMNHAMTGTTVSRHFGPRTLRTQDISALFGHRATIDGKVDG